MEGLTTFAVDPPYTPHTHKAAPRGHKRSPVPPPQAKSRNDEVQAKVDAAEGAHKAGGRPGRFVPSYVKKGPFQRE